MLPVLQVGPLAVQTYLLALLAAGWGALGIAAWAARRRGLDGDDIYNAGLYGLVAGVLGGRLAHVVAYWSAYRSQPLEIFGFNSGAFILWPGVISALITAGWYIRRRKLPLGAVLDAAAMGLLVGSAITNIGALLDGRALGAATGLPWAIPLWGIARHPSQLYEAIATFAIAALTFRMLSLRSRPGVIALIAVLGYGLARWLLEPFRAESAVVLGGVRLPQVLGLAAALISLFGIRAIAGRAPQIDD